MSLKNYQTMKEIGQIYLAEINQFRLKSA